MQKIWMTIGAAMGAGLLAASPAAAVTVLDVNPTSGCGKTNCFDDKGVFKQTWSATGAGGPMTVGQFLMSRGVLGDLVGKTFRVSFSAGGKEIGSWGSYNMAGIGGDTLKFDGSDFLWNPEDGDLVLSLEIAAAPKGGVGGFGGGGFARAPKAPGSEPFGGEPGPSSLAPPTVAVPPPGPSSQIEQLALAVPEPTAWALMIVGFGMAGATLRRRRPALAHTNSKRLT